MIKNVIFSQILLPVKCGESKMREKCEKMKNCLKIPFMRILSFCAVHGIMMQKENDSEHTRYQTHSLRSIINAIASRCGCHAKGFSLFPRMLMVVRCAINCVAI
jgi:hypothetical protein